VEQYERIRRDHRDEVLSIRAPAGQHGVHKHALRWGQIRPSRWAKWGCRSQLLIRRVALGGWCQKRCMDKSSCCGE